MSLKWIAMLLLPLSLPWFWLEMSSNVFLKPISFEVRGDTLHFVRATPHGEVWAEAKIDIVMDDGFQCPSPDFGMRLFDALEGGVASRPVFDFMKPCLARKAPYTIHFWYRVWLGQWFPLPVSHDAFRVEM